jgi:hypothetical protein
MADHAQGFDAAWLPQLASLDTSPILIRACHLSHARHFGEAEPSPCSLHSPFSPSLSPSLSVSCSPSPLQQSPLPPFALATLHSQPSEHPSQPHTLQCLPARFSSQRGTGCTTAAMVAITGKPSSMAACRPIASHAHSPSRARLQLRRVVLHAEQLRSGPLPR